MPYPVFDRSQLKLRSLAERQHKMNITDVLNLSDVIGEFDHPDLSTVVDRIVTARRNGKPVILMMGAHVIKVGLSRFVIDLMDRGLITHLAGNGACAIHDFELARIGATTEDVARYIRAGEFGLWTETGTINNIAKDAAAEGIGFGEAIGKHILENDFPHTDVSIFATAARLGIPATVHVSIGYDIIHEHPNCDGAALGAASYTDFLVFTESISKLEGGAFLNYGTAIMGPEVYLKALSMVRNVAQQENRQVAHFTTVVFDLIPLGNDTDTEAPMNDPRYYYRPFKTILVRTVRDGGESYYICGDHALTLPAIHKGIVAQLPSGKPPHLIAE